MPYIFIEIDEHQEAKIVDAINKRQTFTIDGGRIGQVLLKAIKFTFLRAPNSGGHGDMVEKRITESN